MFQGSMVALITPMHPDGSLDWDALDQLVEWHIQEGTDAIIAMGTTGESATLNDREHCQVIRHVVQKVNKRIPVIAGTGANATDEAIHLTECAKGAGADAALLVTPYYNKPTQEGLYQHYEKVAESVDLPQILYNVPGRTACDLLPETVGRLSKISHIVGLKEATGDLDRIQQIRKVSEEGFELYSGDDSTGTDFMLQGGQGVISVTSNVAPKQMHEMCVAALAGDTEKAHQLNEPLKAIHDKLFIESSPIPVKWALQEMGKIESGIRLPLVPLSEASKPAVRESLNGAGLL